jgi:quinol monooxygenase YgiN
MSKTALFIRHQARPGKRDDVRRVWEKHVKPRAAANPAHEAYYFCYDRNDPDVICVFQLYTDEDAMQNFPKGEWYAGYLKEVGEFITVPPQITPADLIWAKSLDQSSQKATPT